MLRNKSKFSKKTVFQFWPFLAKKQPKLTKKGRKLAKFKRLDKIFWNLVCKCFPTEKSQLNNYFGILAKKTAKIDQKWRKLAKSNPFDEIFWNLICSCFPTKENATKKLFSISAFFGLFGWPKSSQNWLKKMKKIVKSIISPLKLFSFT